MAISDNDLDACFSPDDFAVPATFTIDVSTEIEVYGYFTEPSDAAVLYGVNVEAIEPSLICRTSEISDVRNKMAVTVNDDAYTVARIEKVGTGISVVYLKSAA